MATYLTGYKEVIQKVFWPKFPAFIYFHKLVAKFRSLCLNPLAR
jgi:hypothetical protein